MGDFALESLMSLWLLVGLGSSHLKVWLGLHGLLSRWSRNTASKLVQAIRGGFLFLSSRPLPRAWQLASQRKTFKRSKQKLQYLLWSALSSHTIISIMFYWWCRSALKIWEETTQVHEYQKARIIGCHLGDRLPQQQKYKVLLLFHLLLHTVLLATMETFFFFTTFFAPYPWAGMNECVMK